MPEIKTKISMVGAHLSKLNAEIELTIETHRHRNRDCIPIFQANGSNQGLET